MKATVVISLICIMATGRMSLADDSWTRGIISQANDIVVADVVSTHVQAGPVTTRTFAGTDTLQLRVVQTLKGSTKADNLIKVPYNIGWNDLVKKRLEPSLGVVGKRYIVFLQTAAVVDGKLHYRGPGYTLVDDNFGVQPYRASLAQLISDEAKQAKIEEANPLGPVR